MIKQRKLSKMKNKILPTCLQRNYEDSLGEFRLRYMAQLGLKGLRGNSKPCRSFRLN